MSVAPRLQPVRVTAFCCRRSAERAAAEARVLGLDVPGLNLVSVPCSGRVDVLHLLKAFEAGADGVLVMGCYEDACEFLRGNILAGRRVEYAQKLLAEAGLEPGRLAMIHVSPASPHRFARTVREMFDKLHVLGPRGAAGRDGE
ncbi:MAG: hydrogenase iron-sulfur subunit [Bacillota bacterium]